MRLGAFGASRPPNLQIYMMISILTVCCGAGGSCPPLSTVIVRLNLDYRYDSALVAEACCKDRHRKDRKGQIEKAIHESYRRRLE